jgi:hypothetical protein
VWIAKIDTAMLGIAIDHQSDGGGEQIRGEKPFKVTQATIGFFANPQHISHLQKLGGNTQIKKHERLLIYFLQILQNPSLK